MDALGRSQRERLVEVATRLLYAEGIHAVGVDRVIAEVDAARATLYAHFAGKDRLAAAYLFRQSRHRAAAVDARVATCGPGAPSAAPFIDIACVPAVLVDLHHQATRARR